MTEFYRRVTAQKGLAIELLVSSFFINLLALAVPIFVIQVLSRYVASGVGGTLATLTIGVSIAIIMEFCFRILRSRLASVVAIKADKKLMDKTLSILARAKQQALERLSKGFRQEMFKDLDKLQRAYSGNNINSLLDIPFTGIFVLVMALLNIWLALIVICAILVLLIIAWYCVNLNASQTRRQTEVAVQKNILNFTLLEQPDSIRAFNAREFINSLWQRLSIQMQKLLAKTEFKDSVVSALTQSITMVTTVCVIAVGAKLVVAGELDIGSLIGANILAARALGPISRLTNMAPSLIQANSAEKHLLELYRLPLELSEGTTLKQYLGQLQFNDLGFAYPGAVLPLYESLSLSIKAGELLVFCGPNGSGKTTMARLLLGLIEPSRGQVLADGVDLRQMALPWWRTQVCYLPQQLSFINGTLQQNIVMANTELSTEKLNAIINAANLRTFVDSSQLGLNMPLVEGAETIALGYRRRIALARALATEGQLIVFDEPTEGLDQEGARAVYRIIQALRENQKTLVVLTNDETVIKQADYVVDLGTKPNPSILRRDPNTGLGVAPPRRDDS